MRGGIEVFIKFIATVLCNQPFPPVSDTEHGSITIICFKDWLLVLDMPISTFLGWPMNL